MDRLTLRPDRSMPPTVLDASLRESADLIARWHGRDDGRLRYAVTPRFAVSCTAEMLRESAALAARDRHLLADARLRGPRRDRRGRASLPRGARLRRRLRPRRRPRAERTVLAHAIHLSDRELARLVETGTRVAHCPASNLFLASGAMPLGRYLEAGLSVGLGSDVAGRPRRSRSSR